MEVDDEGIAHVRFGDGDAGAAVDPGSELVAVYRWGNGTAGNVGAEIISRIVFCEDDGPEVIRVRNPLPACGGVDPETVADARLLAPLAFRHDRKRAVTASDYAELAGKVVGIQKAAATLDWTGSWYEADIALDPRGAEATTLELRRRVRETLFPFRRIGHDLRVDAAKYVPIELALRVCVLPHYHRGEVKRSILQALGRGISPTGTGGFFHPDNLTFGGEVALSAIVAAVQALPGVESVEAIKFERLGDGDHGERDRGVLALGPLEIARLDGDPAQPENGRLMLDLQGGR